MRYIDSNGNVFTYEQMIDKEQPKLGEADVLTLKWKWWRNLGYKEVQ